MLLTIDRKIIRKVPHQEKFFTWRDRLRVSGELRPIYDELNRRIDKSNRIVDLNWISRNDWTETVFQPIYETACNRDHEQSALFFGLLLWETMMKRDEAWYFIKSDNVSGTTYFRKED